MLHSKLLTAFLCALIIAMQWPMWTHKGGWLAARDQQQLKLAVQADNRLKEARNAQLKADVLGLENGKAALEERARHVLGMVSKDERFVQFTQP